VNQNRDLLINGTTLLSPTDNYFSIFETKMDLQIPTTQSLTPHSEPKKTSSRSQNPSRNDQASKIKALKETFQRKGFQHDRINLKKPRVSIHHNLNTKQNL
jgi:hypothetical protein